MKKHKSIYIEVYKCYVDVFTDSNIPYAAITEYNADKPRSHIAVVFNHTDSATIAHECSHIALAIMHRIGQQVAWGNDEPFAYLCELLFIEITKRINK